MTELDITNDLRNFRTVRTVTSDPRAYARENTQNTEVQKSQWNRKQTSEASETSARQKSGLDLPPDFFETYPKATGRRSPGKATPTAGGGREQWLAVAAQVNAGEFGGADGSTCEALWIGMRGIPNARCREALNRLAKEPNCPQNVRKEIGKLA